MNSFLPLNVDVLAIIIIIIETNNYNNMHTYLYGSPLDHSKSNYWFTSSDGGDYGPGGQNIIVNMYHMTTMNMIF